VKTELDSLTKKVDIICQQLANPETPPEINEQLGYGFNVCFNAQLLSIVFFVTKTERLR
jgi:hypothetical protein